MSQETKPYRTNVHLTFPPTISGAPLVCNLTRLFDLDFNISTAQITPRQEGFLTLELSGSRDACDKGIGYLREKGYAFPMSRDVAAFSIIVFLNGLLNTYYNKLAQTVFSDLDQLLDDCIRLVKSAFRNCALPGAANLETNQVSES